MSGERKKRINEIYTGRIDFYYPIKIISDYNFNQLCYKINEYIDSDMETHKTRIQTSLQEAHDAVIKGISDTPKKQISAEPSNEHSRQEDGTQIILGCTPRGFTIELQPGEMNEYKNRCEELQQEADHQTRIYGSSFTKRQERFVLLPFRVKLCNDNYVWLNAILYLFANGMGILKLELPLKNVPTKPLKEYKFDLYVNEVINNWSADFEMQNSIVSVRDAHISRIHRKCNLDLLVLDDGLKNIILSDYHNVPKRIESISDDIQEDLYRIIAAPVNNVDCASYSEMAKEYLEKHAWGHQNFRYYISTTGGCLSIADEAVALWKEADYQRQCGLDSLTEEDKRFVRESIIRDLCVNIEFSLVILLLKRLNTSYAYTLKEEGKQELATVQREYFQNVIHISELQEGCYGSASEQLQDLTQKMPYYLKTDLANEKMSAIDRILTNEETNRRESMQDFLSIISIIMAVVFGLPAIHETVGFLRTGLCAYRGDIPWISVVNTSIVLWIILIIGLLYVEIRTKCLFRKKKSRRANKERRGRHRY